MEFPSPEQEKWGWSVRVSEFPRFKDFPILNLVWKLSLSHQKSSSQSEPLQRHRTQSRIRNISLLLYISPPPTLPKQHMRIARIARSTLTSLRTSNSSARSNLGLVRSLHLSTRSTLSLPLSTLPTYSTFARRNMSGAAVDVAMSEEQARVAQVIDGTAVAK